MKAWFRLLRARTLLLFSVAVVLIGLVPVLYLLGLLAWQFNVRLEGGPWVALPSALMFADHALLQGGKVAPVLAYIPQFPPWAWSTHDAGAYILGKLHVGMAPALIGCAIMAVGVSGMLRQRAMIRIQQDRNRDRVRRIQEYRRDTGRADALDGRVEPFIGGDGIARGKDRRVA
jgi:hypothetical protein